MEYDVYDNDFHQTTCRSAVIKITVTVNKTAKVGKELVNNATVSSLR